MPRKPTLEDAFLLALLEAKDDGLNNTRWYMIKPSEFQESYDAFIKMNDKLVTEKLIDYIDFLDHHKLTTKGKEKAHTIEDEISPNEYVSLITRISPKEELRKRIHNIETFIVSSSFVLLSSIGLLNLKNIPLPSQIIFVMFIFYFIIFIIGFTYSISNLFRIVVFWAYYLVKYEKTGKKLIIFYKENENIIKNISSYILLPVLFILIIVYVLDFSIEYAALPLIFQIFKPYIFRRYN